MEIEYKTKKYLQTKPERDFYIELRKATVDSQDIIIAPQVHIERVINMTCQPVSSRCEYYVRNGFNTLSFDFVVFNKSFTPLLAIELDDISHEGMSRKRRDLFVEEICREAGLDLWRLHKQESYDGEEIKKHLFAKLSKGI